MVVHRWQIIRCQVSAVNYARKQKYLSSTYCQPTCSSHLHLPLFLLRLKGFWSRTIHCVIKVDAIQVHMHKTHPGDLQDNHLIKLVIFLKSKFLLTFQEPRSCSKIQDHRTNCKHIKFIYEVRLLKLTECKSIFIIESKDSLHLYILSQ